MGILNKTIIPLALLGYEMLLLYTRKNGDFDAISLTERRY